MNVKRIVTRSAVAVGLTLFAPGSVLAHCDSLDGPVKKAAQQALETRNLSQVLIWVRADDEPEARAAFEKTLAVHALSPQANELADRYFFETVVRVHRAGEGAAYTGLKPGDVSAGRQYIKTYVEFIHYVERLYEATATPAHGRFAEAETGETRR